MGSIFELLLFWMFPAMLMLMPIFLIPCFWFWIFSSNKDKPFILQFLPFFPFEFLHFDWRIWTWIWVILFFFLLRGILRLEVFLFSFWISILRFVIISSTTSSAILISTSSFVLTSLLLLALFSILFFCFNFILYDFLGLWFSLIRFRRRNLNFLLILMIFSLHHMWFDKNMGFTSFLINLMKFLINVMDNFLSLFFTFIGSGFRLIAKILSRQKFIRIFFNKFQISLFHSGVFGNLEKLIGNLVDSLD